MIGRAYRWPGAARSRPDDLFDASAGQRMPVVLRRPVAEQRGLEHDGAVVGLVVDRRVVGRRGVAAGSGWAIPLGSQVSVTDAVGASGRPGSSTAGTGGLRPPVDQRPAPRDRQARRRGVRTGRGASDAPRRAAARSTPWRWRSRTTGWWSRTRCRPAGHRSVPSSRNVLSRPRRPRMVADRGAAPGPVPPSMGPCRLTVPRRHPRRPRRAAAGRSARPVERAGPGRPRRPGQRRPPDHERLVALGHLGARRRARGRAPADLHADEQQRQGPQLLGVHARGAGREGPDAPRTTTRTARSTASSATATSSTPPGSCRSPTRTSPPCASTTSTSSRRRPSPRGSAR